MDGRGGHRDATCGSGAFSYAPGAPIAEEGYVDLPEKPGPGVELEPDVAERFLADGSTLVLPDVSHNLSEWSSARRVPSLSGDRRVAVGDILLIRKTFMTVSPQW